MGQHQEEPQQITAQSLPADAIAGAQAGFSSAQAAPVSANVNSTIYYVIIGRGTAAVVNHTTLRQTDWGKQRIGNLPVMHIGFEDPWRHYRSHRMGQNSHLLSMPGYEKRPSTKERMLDRPRISSRFAADTRHEFKRLKSQYNTIEVMSGFVALIQPVQYEKAMMNPGHAVRVKLEGEGIDTTPFNYGFQLNALYRLLVVGRDQVSRLVYADKIDICTGSGRPRVLKDLSNTVSQFSAMSSIIQSGLSPQEWDGTKPWEPPEVWTPALKGRRVICGTEALYREVDWGRRRRICVMGEGGVGVNMVERGEKADAWLDWIAKDRLSDQCFHNPRNHTILKHPLSSSKGRMQADEFLGANNHNAVCDPALKKWRFGQDSVVVEVHVGAGGMLNITYQTYDNGHPTYVRNSQVHDYYEVDTPLLAGCFSYSSYVTSDPAACPRVGTKWYDRLIVCSGQDSEQIGQPYEITQLFRNKFAALTLDHQVVPLPLLTAAHHMVGLCVPADNVIGSPPDDETCQVSVRVLGVASFVIPNWPNRNSKSAEQVYKSTLPRQAQIVGFTFCGVAIAHANHYFDQKQNDNVNTATTEEIEALVGNQTLADAIEDLRSDSASGFVTIDQLKNELRNLGITGLEAVDNLSEDYRPPDPFWN